MENKVITVAIDIPLHGVFDYAVPDHLKHAPLLPGCRVSVPFRNKQKIGLIMGGEGKSSLPFEKLKFVTELLDDSPVLNEEILKLCEFASRYYHHPLGEVIFTSLPKRLRRGKKAEIAILKKSRKAPTETPPASLAAIELNADQHRAATEIITSLNQFKTFLLDGVTGSGKTEVYIAVIEQLLESGKQALILVPEIALTPQTVQRFQQRLPTELGVLHSGLSEGARANAWLRAANGSLKIIIGTRSALFTPFENLGIIIVDEEHDGSYKQQEGFRYHARDLALIRARNIGIPVVLGSATPSLESFYNAKLNRFQKIVLPIRAGNANRPEIYTVDMRGQPSYQPISIPLQRAIHDCLSQNQQAMLFLNRRGFAPALICSQCGWVATCSNCDVKLTLHLSPNRLLCHHCANRYMIFESCTQCASHDLKILGKGTERLEQTLAELFPTYHIARIDSDSIARKGELQKILQQIHAHEFHIILGTQILAKGHHFPEVTLVGIVDIDSYLFSSDFRAQERVAQLLTQVAGRAGRGDKAGKVYLQTSYPNHVLLQNLLTQEYRDFSEYCLAERQQTQLPPYAYLALIRADSPNPREAFEFLSEIQQCYARAIADVSFHGPIPALIERRAGRYRANLMIQSKKRANLHQAIDTVANNIHLHPASNKLRWSIDIDPVDLL